MTDVFPFLNHANAPTPPGLIRRARACPTPRVALVNAGADLPLAGLKEAVEAGLALPILIGDREKIMAAAERIRWDISDVPLVHAPKAAAAVEAARLAREGRATAIMKGQVHTSIFLKGLLPASAGLKSPGARCGHVFHITAPGSERPLLLTDAALNVSPDMETRRECLRHAVRLARLLGIRRPKAAILSANEDPIPSLPDSMEAAAIAAWAREAIKDADVSGPMALDLIWSKAAAETKNYVSPVAGDAHIVLVPNVTTGNAIFKLMALGMGCCAGGVVMGANVPILLTSRSQGAPARLASAALGAIVAAGDRE